MVKQKHEDETIVINNVSDAARKVTGIVSKSVLSTIDIAISLITIVLTAPVYVLNMILSKIPMMEGLSDKLDLENMTEERKLGVAVALWTAIIGILWGIKLMLEMLFEFMMQTLLIIIFNRGEMTKTFLDAIDPKSFTREQMISAAAKATAFHAQGQSRFFFNIFYYIGWLIMTIANFIDKDGNYTEMIRSVTVLIIMYTAGIVNLFLYALGWIMSLIMSGFDPTTLAMVYVPLDPDRWSPELIQVFINNHINSINKYNRAKATFSNLFLKEARDNPMKHADSRNRIIKVLDVATEEFKNNIGRISSNLPETKYMEEYTQHVATYISAMKNGTGSEISNFVDAFVNYTGKSSESPYGYTLRQLPNEYLIHNAGPTIKFIMLSRNELSKKVNHKDIDITT